MGTKKIYTIIVISCIVSSCITFALLRLCYPTKNIIIKEEGLRINTSVESKHPKTNFDLNFVNAVNSSKSSVVSIRAISSKKVNNQQEISVESGSGVTYSPDGYIVTNYHVVKNADQIEVTLSTNRQHTANVVGYDTATDLAVLKIETQNAPHIVFGNSDQLQVGEWVLAIGNPYRLQSTVTAGIVSAKGRNINILEQSDIESFIQTDAAVNPGNSGGALVNLDGRLIGVNTAIISDSGQSEGFSFAIPVNLVKKVVLDIMEYGTVQRGWLGISISNVDDKIAKEKRLSVVQGVIIDIVNGDGAAEEAGIKCQDIVQAVNKVDTYTSSQFMEQIARYRPADKINLSIIRDGQKLNKVVVLRNYMNTTEIIKSHREDILKNIGIEVRNLNSIEKNKNESGIKVKSIKKQSKIDSTNMQAGFYITKVNKKGITTVEEFIRIISNAEGSVLLEGYYNEYPGHFPYQFVK